MLVIVKRQEMETMDDASLIWTCIEPTIRQIRGKSFLIKSTVSSQLNKGQRALLMFQVFYGHSGNGVIELFTHLSWLFSQHGLWSELKKGIRYFGDLEIIHLLDEMEEVYHILEENHGNTDTGWLDAAAMGIDNLLRGIIERLDNDLVEMMPAAVKAVGAYLRNHSFEFMEIED